MPARTIILLILTSVSSGLVAKGIYQEPEAFIDEVYDGDPPSPEVIWLTRSVKETAKEILGHSPGALRVRFWGRDHRTAWILEEIGKEQPITVGLVVEHDRLKQVKVLVFRESRGWEVRHPFFTDQFKDAGLDTSRELDKNIDGISGATLSVRALNKLARLALYLHRQSAYADDPP